jgi:NAD(P)-dependent dehydrogenase (short-subunit alcohol dehydrogenase family)
MSPHGRGTVIITGASTGIGRTTALRLAAAGYRVFAGVRNEADATALRAAASEGLTPLRLEVTDSAAIAAATEQVPRPAADELFAVVNNAAISVPGPMEFLPLEDVRAQLEVNLMAPLLVARAFLPHLRAAADRRIVNVSSINGRIAQRFIDVYSASKFGVEGLSDALRRELRPWRIKVVVVQPGTIATPIFETSRKRARTAAQQMPPRAHELYGRVLRTILEKQGRAPKRAIPPEQVAKVIERALTARRPRLRYPVGWDARLAALFSPQLFTRLLDRLLSRQSPGSCTGA